MPGLTLSGCMSRFLIYCFFFTLLPGLTFAQKHHKKSAETQLLSTNNQPIDQLLERVEDVHITLNRINNISGSGFNTTDIDQNLPRVQGGLNLIRKNLGNGTANIDVNDLQLYDVMLDNIQEKLGTWKDQLVVYEKELVKMNEDMRTFTSTNDTTFKKLSIDTSYRKLFASEMHGLKDKWVRADSATKVNFKRINALQAQVSTNYFQSIELADKLNILMKDYWVRTLGPEYSFLWDFHKVHIASPEAPDDPTASFQQSVFFRFYMLQAGKRWVLLILACLGFFGLVSYHFYQSKFPAENTPGLLQEFKYISPFPVLATLTLLLIGGPFLDLTTPSLYLEIIQIALLVVLGLLYFRVWPRQILIFWGVLGVLFVVFTLIDSISDFTRLERLILIIANSAAIFFALVFRRRIRSMREFHSLVSLVLVVFIFMNLAAIAFNCFGRMTQADEFSLAAVYFLIEIFALNTMVHIFKEFIDLELLRYQLGNGKAAGLKDQKIKALLGNFFILLMCYCAVISLLDNLNILDTVWTSVTGILNSPIKLGSLVFSLGNLGLFIFIIYISNLIQKFLGFFLGDTDEYNPDFNKKGSRLAVLRLLLLFVGFLLAVGASGLPLDKITILLGALSVGIGLGLQNIVHNLVSGIILIFERPFKIGDLVEIGTRKGRVKDIGIRSSKLITTEGSEVIVPNGDLLSERVVNWTFNNSNVRTELLVKIASGADIELAKKLISDLLNADEAILKRIAPEVFLNNITEAAIELRVLVWINNLHEEQTFKSDMLIKIFASLSAHEIKMI